VALLLAALFALGGCSDDDCVSCVELEPPPAPSGVFSLSGDEEITVYWNDIYFKNPDQVVAYRIYSRPYPPATDDEAFVQIGEVAWNENFDPDTGRHWFIDDFSDVTEPVNGFDFEYAVSAVNAAGLEGPLSLEIVIDTPLPISDAPVEVFDVTLGDPFQAYSGFDFSLAAEGGDGRVDPVPGGTTADIQIVYREGVAYVETVRAGVRIQDYGIFLTSDETEERLRQFQAASWAPADGYSSTGVLELIDGHVYILEIPEPVSGETHYAKLGITTIGTQSVRFLWAYQLVPDLRELQIYEPPDDASVRVSSEFEPIKL
jgi:hypothetical protein